MVQEVKTTDVRGQPLKAPVEVDRYLWSNLNELKKWVDNDWDNLGLNVGMEGAGKSETSMLCALLMNHRLSLDDVFFTANQFDEWVDEAPKGSVGVWDEGDEMGGHWASEVVKSVKSKMKQMRDKNLTLFINTPTMEDLGKYFVIHRTRFLIYTFARAADNRGWYHLFDYHQKHELYLNIKKYHELKKTFDYSKKAVTAGYIKGISNQECVKEAGGDWSVLLGFTQEEYKAKKDAARRSVQEEQKKPHEIKRAEKMQIMINAERFFEEKGFAVQNKELARILGIGERTYYDYRKLAEEEGLYGE